MINLILLPSVLIVLCCPVTIQPFCQLSIHSSFIRTVCCIRCSLLKGMRLEIRETIQRFGGEKSVEWFVFILGRHSLVDRCIVSLCFDTMLELRMPLPSQGVLVLGRQLKHQRIMWGDGKETNVWPGLVRTISFVHDGYVSMDRARQVAIDTQGWAQSGRLRLRHNTGN